MGLVKVNELGWDGCDGCGASLSGWQLAAMSHAHGTPGKSLTQVKNMALGLMLLDLLVKASDERKQILLYREWGF